MGKRELVIIAAFLLVGAAAYHLTAPPAVDGQGFSLSKLIRHVRSEVNPASGRFVHKGQWPAPGSLRELRLEGVRQVTVTGEDRADIDYELAVESTGPDQTTAEGYARQTVLETDDLGDGLMVSIQYPEEAQQTATLTLRVPARLAIRIAGRAQSTVQNVASLHLDRSSGETNATTVAGEITGTHLGRLAVDGAEAVDLTVRNSRVSFAGVRRGLRLNVTSGEVTIASSRGAIEIEQQNAEVRIGTHEGAITVNGTGGEIFVDRPGAELRLDLRRAEVEVTVGPAVAMTLITTDEVLRLLFDEADALAIDAAATRGEIQAGEFGLTPETAGPIAKLSHRFGGRGANVAKIIARNERGDIVLRKRK